MVYRRLYHYCKTQRFCLPLLSGLSGMVAIDANGNLAAGTSTNGLGFKIAG
jgi:isoaspartyl peptidase/L-asparaginase-like protein (Ntn-hydrolase superfamily)